MKKLVLCFALLFWSLSHNAQTLYVKLKQPLEQSQGLLDKVGEQFTVNFVKNEKTSTLLNAPIYKIEHSLTPIELKQLHQLVQQDNHVVYASLQLEAPSPPNDIPPTTPDFIDDQTYLKSDPGVDAFYAWDQGADGSNVSIRLLEYGLNFNHEELVGRNIQIADGMSISQSAVNLGYTDHGTRTSGVLFGDNGGYGVKGIAHNANSVTLYPEWEEGLEWDRILAVTNAITEASLGDVIVYEMQIQGVGESSRVPAEYDPLVWDLTQTATTNGLVVVAAAGNGGNNLDSSSYTDYMARGDSGAIIVGASATNTSHETLSFSTYGSRVNINAWGFDVFTAGFGTIQIGGDANQSYANYNGTSSATAISGGCVAALQSYYYSISGGQYLSSVEMRDLLIETGIDQPDDEPYPAGKFINLRAAIERLDVLSNDDESFGDRLIVYPNPTEGFVTVKNENLTSGELEVYDSLGKRLISQTISREETQLDLSSFSQGIYFVKIVSGSKSGIKRIVKN